MAEPEPAGLGDAVLLAPLTEDSFLHNLHVRYKRDIIYVSPLPPPRLTCRRSVRTPSTVQRPSLLTDVRGQRADLGEPVPAAPSLLHRAGAHLPHPSAVPAASPPVRHNGDRVPVGARQEREPMHRDHGGERRGQDGGGARVPAVRGGGGRRGGGRAGRRGHAARGLRQRRHAAQPQRQQIRKAIGY